MLSLLMYLALAAPSLAQADPELSIKMVAEKEVRVVEDGKEVVKRVPTLEIESGATLYFTLRVENAGDEAATNVVVDNPVPEDSKYIEGSAKGDGSTVTFSIDHGKTYAAPEALTYEFTRFDGQKEQRKAKADMYTDIRWVVAEIPPGESDELYFQIKVN